jgi:hypothetical protein
MRVFLITLVTSTIASVGFWQFGLAGRVWPAHPLVATILLATACGVAVQIILSGEAGAQKTK